VEIEMVRRRVQTRMARKRTGPEEWLVVTRRPLTDTRPLEAKAFYVVAVVKPLFELFRFPFLFSLRAI
jgi:hypothetical protein